MNPSRCRTLALAVLALLALMAPCARASWSSDPAIPLPVCSAAGSQSGARAVACPGGGAIVAWVDTRDGGVDIFAQRLDGMGNPVWAADGIPVCTAVADDRQLGGIAPDGAGGVILSWTDNRRGYRNVYLQRLDPGGHALWTADGEPLHLTDFDQTQPDVAPDGAGGVVAVWREVAGPGNPLSAQRVNASGAIQWDAGGVALADGADTQNPQVVPDGSGGMLVCWLDARSGYFYDAYAQRLDLSGTAQWIAGGVKVSASYGGGPEPKLKPGRAPQDYAMLLSVYSVSVLPDGSGGAIVAWRERLSPIGPIYQWDYGRAQRLDASGNLMWDPRGVLICAADGMADASVNLAGVPDGSGGILIGWAEASQRPFPSSGLTHLDPTGAVAWTSTGCPVAFGWRPLLAVSDGAGGMILACGGSSVTAQRYDMAGTPLWPAPVTLASPGNQPVMIGDGSGGAIMAWADDPTGLGSDIFAGRVSASGMLGGDQIGAAPPAGACISSAHPCVTVPLNITYAGSTPIRGYSVTFTLSPELALCDSLIVERPYLSGVAGTQFEKLDNGGGSYTVDCAILGGTCGASGSGTLFVLKLASAAGAATGTVTVTAVLVRSCDNDSIPVGPGLPAGIPIDNTASAAIADLAAAQQRTGNPAGSTTQVQVSWSGVAAEDSVKLFRASFGHYPEYDDAGGAVPAVPGAYPPGAPWVRVATVAGGAGGCTDLPGTRDFWYYVAYVLDPCGNVSAVSNRTLGTLDYHLGDVSDGSTPGTGNNAVSTEDISLLGMHYGIALTVDDTLSYLDVGPTTSHHVDGRPLTDGKVNFEDLILFAINYDVVSRPSVRPLAAARDGIALELTGGPRPVARLVFSGTGRVQGVSVRLTWDPKVVEPVGSAAGALLESQGGVAFLPAAGCVDAAVLGSGRGLAGEGTLALVAFRRIADGDPGIAMASVDARDTNNERVDLAAGVSPATPVATGLRSMAPNPFRGSTTVEYGLASAGPVKLTVHSVDGRKVAVLWSGIREAGVHRVGWNGLGARGEAMPAGVYFARLQAGVTVQTRRLVLLK